MALDLSYSESKEQKVIVFCHGFKVLKTGDGK
jgi:hypothetical protein